MDDIFVGPPKRVHLTTLLPYTFIYAQSIRVKLLRILELRRALKS